MLELKSVVNDLQELIESAPAVNLNDADAVKYFRDFADNVAMSTGDYRLIKLVAQLDEVLAAPVETAVVETAVVETAVVETALNENLEDRAALIELLEYLATRRT